MQYCNLNVKPGFPQACEKPGSRVRYAPARECVAESSSLTTVAPHLTPLRPGDNRMIRERGNVMADNDFLFEFGKGRRLQGRGVLGLIALALLLGACVVGVWLAARPLEIAATQGLLRLISALEYFL